MVLERLANDELRSEIHHRRARPWTPCLRISRHSQPHRREPGVNPRRRALRIDADASLPGYRVADFDLRAEVPLERVDRRRALLAGVERQVRELERQPELAATRGHYDRAFSLLSARRVLEAFDLSKEDPKLRERYGMNIHGQAVLQARRLVEAGVPLVTVFWQNDGLTNVSVYWDTHNRNFLDLKTRLCPVADQAFATLLDDLEQRGLLDETLVLWTARWVGRHASARVWLAASAGRDGRDHWAKVFTSVLPAAASKEAAFTAQRPLCCLPCKSNPTSRGPGATVTTCSASIRILRMTDRLGRPLVLCDGTPIQAIIQS